MKDVERMVDLLKKHPEKEYSIQDFREQGLFPWTRNDRTIANLIRYDNQMTGGSLQARIEGSGTRTRYFVKGRNIIKYIKTYGAILAPRRK